MGVEVGFSKAGEVLAATKNVGIAQAAQEFVGVQDGLVRIRGNGASAEYGARGGECEVKYRSEVHIEAEGPNLLADQAAMPAEELLVLCCCNVGHGGRRSNSITQAVDIASFEIDTTKQRLDYMVLAFLQKLETWLGGSDVAREQDHAGRLNGAQNTA